MLTMAFLSIDNRRDLPEVSYSTALDYFLGTCFGLVLATILQFASKQRHNEQLKTNDWLRVMIRSMHRTHSTSTGVHYFTKHGSGEVEPLVESDIEDAQEEFGTPGKVG